MGSNPAQKVLILAQPLAGLIGTALRRRLRPAQAVATALLAATLAAQAAMAEQSFDDPFAYCTALGTIDAPDPRYAGPSMPDALARGLKSALGLPDGAPLEPLREHSTWRCMAGRVYACTFGANLPCEEKADTSRSPHAGYDRVLPGRPRRRCHPHGRARPGHRVCLALRGRRPGDRASGRRA